MAFGSKARAAKAAEKDRLQTGNTQAAEEIKTVSPLQAAMDAKAQKFLDWEGGTGEYAGQPKDVTAAPGYDNLLDIYGNAEAMQAHDRVGNPGAAFAQGAHPGFSRQLEQQNAMQRYNTRASGLNEGLTGLRNQALGLAQAGSEADFNRKKAYGDLMLGQTSEYYRRPKKQPFWQQLVLAGIAGGSQMGAASLGNPG